MYVWDKVLVTCFVILGIGMCMGENDEWRIVGGVGETEDNMSKQKSESKNNLKLLSVFTFKILYCVSLHLHFFLYLPLRTSFLLSTT